jgi:signal-transduction protein with cAMP-binding, CBS, and nucleotidyltransferase domain
MFIVEDGRVNNILRDHVLATTKPGEMFGVVSLITHRARNSSAACESKKCRLLRMSAADFFEFMDSSPVLKSSVNDVFLRREFEKAVAHRTKKTFPLSRDDLRKVFDSIDTHDDGYLTLEELRSLLVEMDKDVPDDLVMGIMNSLDIDSSGVVDFGEFCHIFGKT